MAKAKYRSGYLDTRKTLQIKRVEQPEHIEPSNKRKSKDKNKEYPYIVRCCLCGLVVDKIMIKVGEQYQYKFMVYCEKDKRKANKYIKIEGSKGITYYKWNHTWI